MKQILTGILAILNSSEKIKLGKLIIFDLVIGILDIAFWGLQLVVTSFHTKNATTSKISFRPKLLDFHPLILNEPYSEKDSGSENSILSKLQLLTQQGKMIFFITNNKASLTFCDKILSLDEA